MKLRNSIRWRRSVVAGAVGFAIWLAQPLVSIGAQDAGPALYRWLDSRGVVRYTPDLSRIPSAQRKTVVRVVAPATPAAAQPAAAIPIPDPSADPFNAPDQARRVDAKDIAPGTPVVVSSWPELDERIAELEALVAIDEESIKRLISSPQSEEYDDLIHSAELREIAARLPVLQTELNELRRWRDDSEVR